MVSEKKPGGIRETQIKTTTRYHLIPIRMTITATINKKKTNVGKDVKKLDCSTGGNVKWYSHCGKQYSGSPKFFKQNYHMIQQFHSGLYNPKN